MLHLPLPEIVETWRVDGQQGVTLDVASLPLPLLASSGRSAQGDAFTWDVAVGDVQPLPQADARAETFRETTRLFTVPGLASPTTSG